MKDTDVFPGSSILVEGKLPYASLLLIGPTGVGKTIFCKQFIHNGLVFGEPCVYLATDESPEEICKSMKRIGFDVEMHKRENHLRIIDCYSWKLGRQSQSDYVVSNPADFAVVMGTIDRAIHGLKNVRFVFDSITGLVSSCRHASDETSKFLQILVAKIRAAEGNAIFIVSPEAHDQQFMSILRQTFDGTLEMKEDETGKEIKRLLRVFSLKEAKHKTNWTPFEITNQGIVVKNDSELRCVMCSRLIRWEPVVEHIGEKQFNFDSLECAKTYRKLKSLYGENFE